MNGGDVRSKSRAMQLPIVLCVLVCAGIAAGGRVRAASQDGWYTQDQATRGHQLFNNYCAQCHRPDLTGAAGPALVGDAFLKQWSNKPLSELFGFEHSEMPATNPVPSRRISCGASRLTSCRRTVCRPDRLP